MASGKSFPLAGPQFPTSRMRTDPRGLAARTGRPGDVRCRSAGSGAFTTAAAAPSGMKMALKFVNKSKTKLKNFLREVSITNSLSSSPFIIKVFDVVFETEDCYVFAQEYAPAGDLFDIIPPQVLGVVAQGRGGSSGPRTDRASSYTRNSGDPRGETRQQGHQGLPRGGALEWGESARRTPGSRLCVWGGGGVCAGAQGASGKASQSLGSL